MIANSSVRYADENIIGTFGVRHVDKRYFTILNDFSVPAYTVSGDNQTLQAAPRRLMFVSVGTSF